MADEKTYTEDEHIGILTERVRRETADLTATVETLTGEKTELENKLDLAESAKVAAETKAAETEEAFTAFKGEVEEQREAASRQEARVAKLREVAAHLPDEWFEDTARMERICAMADEAFEGYAADLGTTNTVAPKGSAIPRETAMVGAKPPVAGASAPTNARGFLLRKYEKTEV